MKRTDGPAYRPRIRRRILTAGLLVCCLAAAAGSQSRKDPQEGDRPDAEFQIARIMYATNARAGSHGTINPMWAVDYPLAEEHFLANLRRYTRIDAAEDTRHLALTDDRLFQYPFAWIQQPGFWNPTEKDVTRLREYLARGGFLILDDFHGGDWDNFEDAIGRVFPDRPLVDIPKTIPSCRSFSRSISARRFQARDICREGLMEKPWRGRGRRSGRAFTTIDDRLMVVANYNMDLGDAWEHADDPEYPLPMTAFAYKLGVNYVLYAMTH